MLPKTKGKEGFTLVELAIVLVIIGLLLGAILKGQEMIKNAKMKRIKSDIDGIVAATYSYQDRYNYLPGDDPNDRSARPPAGLNATGCTGGNGDGHIYVVAGYDERICFWQELAGAGFISGDPTNHTNPQKISPYGTPYNVNYNKTLGKNYIYVNLPNEVIKYLDEKYDDGVYNTGDIRSNHKYTYTGMATMYWYAF
ncbi:type II secretion system protein [Hippea alviniae]|uniref:type II secretion system protein n=1 Tax=Hippea alviniae TaxID=1279027 RepID=UPI0003B2E70A|nr:prepilin-type N-terminal cleavage/methylation domain-containing protein [Hippea alviniae]